MNQEVFVIRLGTEAAARALDISPRKLEDLISSGAITCHQDAAGGPRYISVESLKAYVKWREEQPVIGRFARRAS